MIALSATNDRRIQSSDSIEMYGYRTSKDIIGKNVKIE